MNLLHKTSSSAASGTTPTDSSTPEAPYRRPPVRFRGSAVLGWVFVLVVLATGPLERWVPEQSGSAYFSAAGLGALAVLGAITVAELRRARAMARAGLRLDRIEMGFMRGRVFTADEPQTPRDLRRISWAGPLVLAAAGVLLAAIGGLFSLASSPGLQLLTATALFSAIGVGSLALAELLPAPGSPGSQLIFARAWKRTGQRGTAVLPTAKAGLATGWALLFGGFAIVLLLSFAGLWVMFIGATVIAGSKITLAGARTREQLSGVHARDVMSAAPPEVSAFATAEVAFADVALPSRADVLVVRETDGSFGGIVPVARLAAVPGDDRAEVRVRRLAVPPDQIATVTADQPMEAVLEALARHPLAGVALVTAPEGAPADAQALQLPVVRGPRFIGIITPADVTRTLSLMQASRPGRRAGAPGNPWA